LSLGLSSISTRKGGEEERGKERGRETEEEEEEREGREREESSIMHIRNFTSQTYYSGWPDQLLWSESHAMYSTTLKSHSMYRKLAHSNETNMRTVCKTGVAHCFHRNAKK
jgi:hypothetical protein